MKATQASADPDRPAFRRAVLSEVSTHKPLVALRSEVAGGDLGDRSGRFAPLAKAGRSASGTSTSKKVERMSGLRLVGSVLRKARTVP